MKSLAQAFRNITLGSSRSTFAGWQCSIDVRTIRKLAGILMIAICQRIN